MNYLKTELAVVGGGPAGLMAAIEAARNDVEVVLVDENSRAGGKLYAQIHKFFGSFDHYAGIRGYDIAEQLFSEAKALGVKIFLETIVWGIFPKMKLGLLIKNKNVILEAKKIILATGAVENPLAFPGWTLPGVMGAGAAQVMMNMNHVLPGKNVLIVGSGNIGLVVAYQLLQAGANVVGVVEAVSKIGGYLIHASKIRRAGVPIFVSHTIARADGDEKVEEATIVELDSEWRPIKGTKKKFKVDLICLAVGLRPFDELCHMIGCDSKYFSELGGFVPVHNHNMESSVKGIYVAGDLAGAEEASIALEEGRLAGLSVAESLGKISNKIANKNKKIVRDTLYALRLGPFGVNQQKAKNELMRSML